VTQTSVLNESSATMKIEKWCPMLSSSSCMRTHIGNTGEGGLGNWHASCCYPYTACG
jgi:hypothetical protein